MKLCSEKTGPGFTLVETMTAVALLAFIGVSVWVVLERCMISAADSAQRMRAFEIARENMEKVLGASSVSESTDFGVSEQYPDIRWQTSIESFFDSQSSKAWVRAVCSAEFTDASGKTQSVELTHWLTDLTEEQSQQLMQAKAAQEEKLSQYLIEGEDAAAEYAGVNIQTIREWIRNHMPTYNGAYIKPWLLFYAKYPNPTPQQINDFKDSHPELSTVLPQTSGESSKTQEGEDNKSGSPDDTGTMPEEPSKDTGDTGSGNPPPPPPMK